jgi:ribosomal protein S18 acetylase RimI-like enzyme
MDGVTIRDLREGDAEGVSLVLREGFSWWYDFQRKRGKDVQWMYDAQSPGRVRENARQRGENSKSLVAEVNDKVVGYISASYDPGPRLGVIGIVSVDPGHQGRGIGSALMRSAIEFLKAKGVRKIWTTVSTINTRAILYYLKNGFRAEGILRDHFAEGIDEIFMGMFVEQH